MTNYSYNQINAARRAAKAVAEMATEIGLNAEISQEALRLLGHQEEPELVDFLVRIVSKNEENIDFITTAMSAAYRAHKQEVLRGRWGKSGLIVEADGNVGIYVPEDVYKFVTSTGAKKIVPVGDGFLINVGQKEIVWNPLTGFQM